MTTRGRLLFITLLALISLFGLFDHSLWSGNDTREGAMISEMVREHCWITPVFNGVHYFEKPPLLHWTGIVFCRVSGVVSEGLVRLPAAVYGFGTLLVMLAWARALGREQAGFAAAFMCATSVLFLEYVRVVLTDSALTFMVVFSLWLFWRAYNADARIFQKYFLFLAVSAFSFYAKGLIGPGMIWLSVFAWLCLERRFKLLIVLSTAFGLIFAVALAPWVIALWKTGGQAYLFKVFWENQFGRFLSFDDKTLPLDPYLIHKEPVYYYLFVSPVRLLPWTLLVVPALLYWFRRGNPFNKPPALFIKTSLLAIAVLLHLSSAKAPCYLLPLFPFIFLMTAIWLEDSAEAWHSAPKTPASAIERRLIAVTFIALGVAVIVVPAAYIGLFLFGMKDIWVPGMAVANINFFIAIMVLLTGWLMLRSVWLAFKGGRKKSVLLIMPAVLALAAFVGVMTFVPMVDYYRSYVPFSRLVLKEIQAGRRMVFASDSERDQGAFMFYLNSRLDTVALTNHAAFAAFVSADKGPAGIIVPVKNLKAALQELNGLSYSLKGPENGGKKSNSFRLVIINHALAANNTGNTKKKK